MPRPADIPRGVAALLVLLWSAGSALVGPGSAHADDYLVGVVYARHEIVIAAEETGRLAALPVELGAAVAEGDFLARLDTTALEEDLIVQRADHAVAVAELEIAELKRTAAEQHHERRAAYPDSWAAEEIAQAALDRDLAAAAVKVARAVVDREQATLRLLEIRLAAAEIRAPFAGSIAQRYQEAGAFVQPGMPLVRLISSGDLAVRFSVDEAHVAAATHGAEVRVEVPGVDTTLQGAVNHVGPEVDAAMGRLTVEAVLDVPDDLAPYVKSGMSARVFLPGAG